MIIKQISIFLENKPGQLSYPCQLLADNNINITAASLADTNEFGILRLIVKEHDLASNILAKNGYATNDTEVIAVCVNDTPGGLSTILNLADIHHLNIEYLYAFSSKNAPYATLIFRFSEPEKAEEVLQKNNIKLLSAKDI